MGGGMNMGNDPLNDFVMQGASSMMAPMAPINPPPPSNLRKKVPSTFDSLDPFSNSRGRRNSTLDGIEDVVAPPRY